MEKKIGRKSIYPLTDDNLNALLLNYFPEYPQGTLSNYIKLYKDIGVTLKDLEFCCLAISNYIEELEHFCESELTRCNISMYAVDIYFQPKWPYGIMRAYKDTVAKMIELIELQLSSLL